MKLAMSGFFKASAQRAETLLLPESTILDLFSSLLLRRPVFVFEANKTEEYSENK